MKPGLTFAATYQAPPDMTHHQPKPVPNRPESPNQVRSCRTWGALSFLAINVIALLSNPSLAAGGLAAEARTTPIQTTTPPPFTAKEMGDQVREAIESGVLGNKRITLIVNDKDKNKDKKVIAAPAHVMTPSRVTNVVNPLDSRRYLRAQAAVLTKLEATQVKATVHAENDTHWHYAGDNGPQAWGTLNPDFKLCGTGQRQSPIHIDETSTLQGPAEPLQFNYQPSSGTVVNNGHTIQVDLVGDNTLTVRGDDYKLVQFHFHHPAEERVNQQGFAMVAHLVHKNAEGQLAVVAVLLEPGIANTLIHTIWTYMPLDIGDRVPVPLGLIDMTALLPKDPLYYQFMGSLTTPPCTEDVLWLVFKQPTSVSPAQIRLFSQIFPNNARPVQPINGRAVRDAQ